jgi:hypothetical protein
MRDPSSPSFFTGNIIRYYRIAGQVPNENTYTIQLHRAHLVIDTRHDGHSVILLPISATRRSGPLPPASYSTALRAASTLDGDGDTLVRL